MQFSHVVRPVRFGSAEEGSAADDGPEGDHARSASPSIADEPASAFHLPGYRTTPPRVPATTLEAAVAAVLSKHSLAVEQPPAVAPIVHRLDLVAQVAPAYPVNARDGDPATEDCPYCPAARLKHARFCQRCGHLQDSTGGTGRDPG